MARDLAAPHPDVTSLNSLLGRLRDLHMEMNQKLLEVKDSNIPKGRYSADQDLVDIGYIARSAKDLLEDWRKVSHLTEERAGFTLAMRVTDRSLTNPETETTVHGTLAYANTDMGYIPYLPDKDSPEYFMLTDEMGVPRELASKGGFVKLDFKRIESHICRLIEDGKPLPPWCKGTAPNYKSTFVKKRASAK